MTSDERWVRFKEVSDNHYEVSDLGRMRLWTGKKWTIKQPRVATVGSRYATNDTETLVLYQVRTGGEGTNGVRETKRFLLTSIIADHFPGEPVREEVHALIDKARGAFLDLEETKTGTCSLCQETKRFKLLHQRVCYDCWPEWRRRSYAPSGVSRGVNIDRVVYDETSPVRPYHEWYKDEHPCTGKTSLFFAPARSLEAREGGLLCQRCPVQQDCLRYAMEQRVRDGVWGGLSGTERMQLRQRLGKEKRERSRSVSNGQALDSVVRGVSVGVRDHGDARGTDGGKAVDVDTRDTKGPGDGAETT